MKQRTYRTQPYIAVARMGLDMCCDDIFGGANGDTACASQRGKTASVTLVILITQQHLIKVLGGCDP